MNGGIFGALGIDVGIIVIIQMILIAILLLLVMNLSTRLKRLNQKYRSFMKGLDGVTLEKDLTRKMSRIEKFAEGMSDMQSGVDHMAEALSNSVHKYGIVKYDAFDDVGGKLSFVLAMLDDRDTGFVLNAVHSKDNCFLYIKEIINGESYILLSDEEIKALRIAKNQNENVLYTRKK